MWKLGKRTRHCMTGFDFPLKMAEQELTRRDVTRNPVSNLENLFMKLSVCNYFSRRPATKQNLLPVLEAGKLE